MCEINPKRQQFFRLEFYTSQDVTLEEWRDLLMPRLNALEQAFNASGMVRVHIHEEDHVESKGTAS